MAEGQHTPDWIASYSQGVSRRAQARSPEPVTALDRWILNRLQDQLGDAPVRFALWDGSEARHRPASPVGRILIHDRGALAAVAWNADLHLGEGYSTGRIDVEGELVAVIEAVNRETLKRKPARPLIPAIFQRPNTLADARRNIHHHYDIGNDFYRLWLDEELLYTCAYFPTPDTDLESAQRAKMEHVCRKLALKPGESVVEAGCGWGAFALYMARHFGVTVKAYNISHEQIAYARECARRERLGDRVEFITDDYRNIRGSFDVFVSIGMLEHVGKPNYDGFGAMIDRSLDRARGRGLVHFIGRNTPGELNAWIRRRIFPGAYPPTLREVAEHVLEPSRLSILDVENLRLHYARTLHHWRTRFEAAGEQVAQMFDEPFVRAWRLYLAGSEAAFTTGWMQLFQITFARESSNDIPWTRAATTAVPPV